MPQFEPGESKTAIAPITAKPAGMACEAELFLGPDELTKVASSGRVPFVSTGARQNVRLPIAMPSEGTHHGYIDVFTGGMRFLAYKTKEDVVIAAPAIPQFYMPPEFTKAKITGRWSMPPYYYQMEFECPITNKGNARGTQSVRIWDNQGVFNYTMDVTLELGATYLWKRFQLAVWPMTFYLEGDWEENNYSVGAAA